MQFVDKSQAWMVWLVGCISCTCWQTSGNLRSQWLTVMVFIKTATGPCPCSLNSSVVWPLQFFWWSVLRYNNPEAVQVSWCETITKSFMYIHFFLNERKATSVLHVLELLSCILCIFIGSFKRNTWAILNELIGNYWIQPLTDNQNSNESSSSRCIYS